MALACPVKCVTVFATELLKGLIYGVLHHKSPITLGVLCNSGYAYYFSKIWKVLKCVPSRIWGRDYELPLWAMGSQGRFEQGRVGAGLGRKPRGCWEGAVVRGGCGWRLGRRPVRRRPELGKGLQGCRVGDALVAGGTGECGILFSISGWSGRGTGDHGQVGWGGQVQEA